MVTILPVEIISKYEESIMDKVVNDLDYNLSAYYNRIINMSVNLMEINMAIISTDTINMQNHELTRLDKYHTTIINKIQELSSIEIKGELNIKIIQSYIVFKKIINDKVDDHLRRCLILLYPCEYNIL